LDAGIVQDASWNLGGDNGTAVWLADEGEVVGYFGMVEE
jgi:hypothetical protein